MDLSAATFENIDEVRQAVDPKVFNQALGSTVRRLSDRVGTLVSKEVRTTYPIKASAISSVLRKRFDNSTAVPARLLIYSAARISLRHFATRAPKPVIKTARGPRVGAKVKDRKKSPPRIVSGGFWGRTPGGTEQIFKRQTATSDSKIKKLTGPSVSQMVRGIDVLDAVQKFVEDNADDILRQNLDHFQKRRIGVR